MTAAKHQPARTSKSPTPSNKIEDLVLSSGDIVIVGGAGDARIFEAKAVDPENQGRARGVFIGHSFDPAHSGAEMILGRADQGAYEPLEGHVFIIEGGQARVIKQRGSSDAKGRSRAGAIAVGHQVESSQKTGALVLKKATIPARDAASGKSAATQSVRGFTVQVDDSTGHIVVRQNAERISKSIGDMEIELSLPKTMARRGDPATWPARFGKAPEIMSGTGKEVRRVLSNVPEARVIAVRIETHNKEEAAAAESVFARVAEYLPQLVETRQEETIRKFIEAITPPITLSEAALAQARMLVEARASILKSGDFIDSKEVSKLAGYSATNPAVYPNKWKSAGKIFAISSENRDYFPFYALDPNNGYQPFATVAEILALFKGSRDSWAVALWFASLNSFLDDKRPQDVLATDPDRVIAAARDEMAGVEHG